ncbi:MAG: 3-dehydroquinate synthase [Bacillota bacterium]|nr:3-dehydroquinate synthase [Bacillota bacterium]
MKTVVVNTTSKTYKIHIGHGLLESAGDLSKEVIKASKAAIVTDSTVNLLYADKLDASLKESGFKTVKFCFPAGEKSKNASTLIELLNFLAESHFSREDAVFALGGGVVGDLAGLAASMYMRGIRFVQVPTTMLAAVDSSVGGKTAIDLEAGKNLAGAFYQPDLVLCDTNTLSTLPETEFANGCAEVIKYAIIRDSSLLTAIKPPLENRIDDIIYRCVKIKSDIVGIDERDTGERQILNFGHTFAHAIEKCSAYTVPHGSAVATGMAIITRASVKKKLCDENCLTKVLDALSWYDLPPSTLYGESELFETVLSDKKRSADKITLIIPQTIGHCERISVSFVEAGDFLRLGLED